MRDAFGSTFMLKLFIVFIVFYVMFMTIAVSYAKTFRIKNKVIDILEQNQYDYEDNRANNIKNEIDDYLSDRAYKFGDNDAVRENCEKQIEDADLDIRDVFTENGACIVPTSYDGDRYYRVTLYMVVTMPVLNYSAVFPMSGEAEYFE